MYIEKESKKEKTCIQERRTKGERINVVKLESYHESVEGCES